MRLCLKKKKTIKNQTNKKKTLQQQQNQIEPLWIWGALNLGEKIEMKAELGQEAEVTLVLPEVMD